MQYRRGIWDPVLEISTRIDLVRQISFGTVAEGTPSKYLVISLQPLDCAERVTGTSAPEPLNPKPT